MSATDIYDREELKIWLRENLILKNGKFNIWCNRILKRFNEKLDLIKKFTLFLNNDVINSQRIYCILNDITEVPKCPECGKETNFRQFGIGYSLTCSNKCNQNSEKVREKIELTCNERYGGISSFCSLEVREKGKETCIERYGFGNVSQVKEFQDKKIENSLEKYGCEYPVQSEEVKDNIKETCIKRYGVEHPMQDPEIFERAQKSGFKYKEYISPDDKLYNVQGYEPFALKYLIEESDYNSDDIIVGKDVPRINYHFEDKDHVYFPDIYITSENTLVEVKSQFIYDKELECNIAKKKASKEAGFDHITLIFSPLGELLETIF